MFFNKKRISLLVGLMLLMLTFAVLMPGEMNQTYAEETASYYVNSVSGTDALENGSKESPYKTLPYAITRAESGSVIYLQNDVTITSKITLSKSVKITSDKEEAPFYTINRGFWGTAAGASGSHVFLISGDNELTLENIIIDGNKSAYGDSANSSSLFYLDGLAGTNPTLTIMNGTTVQNAKTTNGGAVCLNINGTVNMYGGLITNNQATVGLSVFAASGSKTFNLYGGEITNNQKTSTGDTGAMSLSSTQNINLGGNIKIHNNYTGGSTNAYRDLVVGDKKINITRDFTGEVHVYSNNYTRQSVFGTIEENVDISQGIFANNRDAYLFGEANNSNLWWEYKFSPATVSLAPTATTGGVLIQQAIKTGTAVYRNINISPLNVSDAYTLTHDTFTDYNPKITYTLNNTTYGEFGFTFDLPSVTNSNYVWEVEVPPAIDNEGEILATHPDYPGVELTYTLPMLDDENYTVTYTAFTGSSGAKLSYAYNEFSLPDFENMLIDVSNLEIDYNFISFYADENYEYAIAYSDDGPDSSTVWVRGGNAVLDFETDSKSDYTIYVTPVYNGSATTEIYEAYSLTTPLSPQDNLDLAIKKAEDELNDYITNHSQAIQEIKDNAVGSLTLENYQNVDDIIAQTKAAIDLQLIKENVQSQLEDYVTEPSDAIQTIIAEAVDSITPDNVDEINNIIADAKAAIDFQLIKENVQSQLEDYVTEPSDAVKTIITEAVDSITPDNVDEINNIIADAKLKIDVQIAKEQMQSEFEIYQNTSDAVKSLIAEAIENVTSENYETIEDLIAQAIVKIELQISKENAQVQLKEVYDNLKEKNLYSQENQALLENYYNEGREAIFSTEQISEIEQQLEQAISLLNGIMPEEILNLWWIIILLLVIMAAEISLIAYKMIKKEKEKKAQEQEPKDKEEKEQKTQVQKTMNKKVKEKKVKVSLLPLLALIIIPNGAILIIILLAIAVLGLAAFIAFHKSLR